MRYCRRHAKLRGVYWDGYTQPADCSECQNVESFDNDDPQDSQDEPTPTFTGDAFIDDSDGWW